MQGIPAQNMINIHGSYFELRGFEITGSSTGLRLFSVDHATFEDLVIHDIGNVGITCNSTGVHCDAVEIRGCEIYNTGSAGNGEGMYLGCNDNACVFSNSTVAENYVHDLGGDQGDGIEVKTGSYGNVVRDNVIVNAKYPAITMYGFPAGAGPRNIVERNFVWGTVDHGIQVVGQVIVRNNIVVDAGNYGLYSKPSQGFDPVDVTIVNNTVYNAGGPCMKTNNWSGLSGQIVANNALYCPGGAAIEINGGAPEATFVANLALGSVDAPGGVSPGTGATEDLGDPASLVFYPPAGSDLINAGNTTHAPSDDFNATPRDDGSPDIGAYERTAATNPGWTLVAGFKDAPVLPDVDAGPGPSDAGAGDVDANANVPDAGPNDPDASPGTPDAASTAADADPGADSLGGGCGCLVRADDADGQGGERGGLLVTLLVLPTVGENSSCNASRPRSSV